MPRKSKWKSKQSVALANESLARSKDRFTSGVTDTVQAGQAEQALSSANDQYITSLYNHSLAKLSLARSLDASQTAIDNAGAEVKAAEQNLESAKALLLQDEANAEKSDADLARYAQLVAKEDISRQQYDQALSAAKANRAAVVSATAAVQSSEQALHQAE